MNWIKKNPAQFALAVVCLLLLVSTFFLYSNYSAFAEGFAGSRTNPPQNKEVPPLESKRIDDAMKAIPSPTLWKPSADSKKEARLFTGKRYVQTPTGISKPEGGMFNPPIPNDWLEKYGLDSLNQTVSLEDPDKDGFSVRIEWDGMDGISHLSETTPFQPVNGDNGQPLPDDSTNPIDPQSHPPYHTRLSIRKIYNIPFRLKFMSIDINPRNLKDITAQINTMDAGNKTRYVPVPGEIPQTKYKTVSYEKKEVKNADGTVKDVSELKVTNTETGGVIALPLGVVVDSPESYAIIDYLWVPVGGQKTPEMNLRKDQSFSIPPETDKKYKVLAIGPDKALELGPDEVLIQLPTGQKYKIKPKK